MEFLEQLGSWINRLLGGFERTVTRIFGAANERRIRQIGFVRDRRSGQTSIVPGSALDRMNQLEPDYERLSEGELKETAGKLRARLADGQTLEQVLPEAFAAVRESAKRYLRMRHYDVQLVGGYILHQGMIAEMSTGEGKTLVATSPAFLNALAGPVHVITVNDYLARRDMEWMGPVHLGLGLTVGAIQSNMPNNERQLAYRCDITYGTNNEFGFDYLRDNMKPTCDAQVQRRLNYAIIDEIDNILIDEARTPLIISGPAHDDVRKYPRAHQIAMQLRPGVDFEIKEKEHTCHLTDEGVRHAEDLAGVESFYTTGNMEWPHLLDNALRAIHLYKRDVNYMVREGEVIIVDEHTGRAMEGRQWSDGLHQAVEAKEGVKIKEESQTLATITLQNFFKLYNKLSGMTGTAMTEANEFLKIYKLDVVAVPPNRPTRRQDFPDAIFRSTKEKWDAVVDEVCYIHESGRPILVGTVSIENSELLSGKLIRRGVKHNVLNAKQHEREAEIIAQAGRKAAVTIATNMAGRGTDIILGGNPEYLAWDELKTKYASRLDVPKLVWDGTTKSIADREGMAAEGRDVAELGGLHVIGTERHDSRRIDLQLRGRAGRQGDNGSSRFILSLEDDLMRKFAGDWVKDWLTRLGMQDGEPIESRMVTSRIESAQKKVEERHFEMRKHLLEYDEVMDTQRKRVYSYRQGILEGADCRELILQMIDRQVTKWVSLFLQPNYCWESCSQFANQRYGIEVDTRDLKGMEYERMCDFLREEATRQAEDQIDEELDRHVPKDVEDERERNWQALANWANRSYGLNLNDRELKKIGVDGLYEYLAGRIKEAIERFDLTPLEDILREDYARRSLSAWCNHQFGITIPADRFVGLDATQSGAVIREEVDAAYSRKEIEFPVTVGMTRFLGESSQTGGERYDREGLARWASGRFQTRLASEDVESKPRHWIAEQLLERSRSFFEKSQSAKRMDEFLDRVYGPASSDSAAGTNGHSVAGNGLHRHSGQTHSAVSLSPALNEMVAWAEAEFQTDLDVKDFVHSSREQAATQLRQQFEQRYRPELNTAERSLILECLDGSWKDHLYYMDHLRQNIGLAAYAQKDPKIEYRREGMRAFDQMWDRISEQVTSAIFRLENMNSEFVGSLWQITSTSHAAPVDEDIEARPEESAAQAVAGTSPSQSPVEPIRNFQQRVGRNDPCPCGSGKKYKKCHGAGG